MPSEPSHFDQQSPLQAARQGRGGLSPLEEGKEGGVASQGGRGGCLDLPTHTTLLGLQESGWPLGEHPCRPN